MELETCCSITNPHINDTTVTTQLILNTSSEVTVSPTNDPPKLLLQLLPDSYKKMLQWSGSSICAKIWSVHRFVVSIQSVVSMHNYAAFNACGLLHPIWSLANVQLLVWIEAVSFFAYDFNSVWMSAVS